MKSPKWLKIAALCMAAVAVFATASCSLSGDSEEETTTERPAVLLEARPESAGEILDFFNRAANAVKAERPGVSVDHSYSVKDVDTGDVPEAEALINFAKNFSDALDGTGETREYGNDLNDSNIRIAPTFPSMSELGKAMDVFTVCVRISSINKILKSM